MVVERMDSEELAFIFPDVAYRTGLGTIDAEHDTLFSLYNTYVEKLKAGCEVAVVEDTLDQLYSYASYHFTNEETLMRKAGFNGLEGNRSHSPC